MAVNALASRLFSAWLLFLKDYDLFELTSLNCVSWSDFLYLLRNFYCHPLLRTYCVVFWALLSQLLLGGDPLLHKSFSTSCKHDKAVLIASFFGSLGVPSLLGVSSMCLEYIIDFVFFLWLHWGQELHLNCWASGLELRHLTCETGRHLVFFSCLGKSEVVILNLTVKHRVKFNK